MPGNARKNMKYSPNSVIASPERVLMLFIRIIKNKKTETASKNCAPSLLLPFEYEMMPNMAAPMKEEKTLM